MANKETNVLITCIGRRVPLAREFQKALCRLPDESGKVVVVDMDTHCSGMYVGDRSYLVPRVDDPDYLPRILEVCQKENIRLVIPTIDSELPLFAREAARFSDLGARAVISSPESVEICFDKLKTFEFFREKAIPTPATQLPSSSTHSLPPFPCVIKPRTGISRGCLYTIENEQDLEFYRPKVNGPIIQEKMNGTEFTIDTISDFNARPIAIVPRFRIRTRAGVSDVGKTFRNPALLEYALQIISSLQIIGPANIQGFIASDDKISFTEINPRFSGGIPLTIASGPHFPEILLRSARGEEIPAIIGNYKSDLVMVRYEESIFFEDQPGSGSI